MNSSLELPLNLVNHFLQDNPQARQEAFDLWLKRKGLILESQRNFQESLLKSDSTRARDTFRELAKVRGRLARLVLAGPGDMSAQNTRGSSPFADKKE